jgi:hypothetical protein
MIAIMKAERLKMSLPAFVCLIAPASAANFVEKRIAEERLLNNRNIRRGRARPAHRSAR